MTDLRSGQFRRRLAAVVVRLAFASLVGYTAYVGFVGSDQLLHPTGNPDCRTPMVRYGWAYEAVNYDIANDAILRSDNPDMGNCSSQGSNG